METKSRFYTFYIVDSSYISNFIYNNIAAVKFCSKYNSLIRIGILDDQVGFEKNQ